MRIDKVFRFKVTADYAEGGWYLPEYYFCLSIVSTSAYMFVL